MEGKIVNFNSYQEKRRELLEAVNYKGEIQVPNIQRSKEEEKRQERYKAPKSNRKKLTKKQRRKAKAKLIRNRAIAVALVGLVVFGGLKQYHEYKDSKNTLTLEQALENGDTLEELGINEEIANKIEKLNTMLEEDLTNEEIIKLATQITNLKFEVAKTKIADVLNVEKEDVRFNAADRDMGASMTVKEKGTYYNDNLTNKILGEKTMPQDIVDYIEDIVAMQEIEKDVLKGDIDREKFLNTYKQTLKETSKFAAGKLEKDEKGNIEIEKTRVSELENKKTKEDKGFEHE